MAASWTFLTNHARVLLCIARDPGIRLRDIAARLDLTERGTYGIVVDLAEAGYIVKAKEGRRNRYEVQSHLPLPEPTSRERTVGEVLALLAGGDIETPKPVRSQPATAGRPVAGTPAAEPADRSDAGRGRPRPARISASAADVQGRATSRTQRAASADSGRNR